MNPGTTPLSAHRAPRISLVALAALLAWGLAEGWALLRSRLHDRWQARRVQG